jgi:hypothetical protein
LIRSKANNKQVKPLISLEQMLPAFFKLTDGDHFTDQEAKADIFKCIKEFADIS